MNTLPHINLEEVFVWARRSVPLLEREWPEKAYALAHLKHLSSNPDIVADLFLPFHDGGYKGLYLYLRRQARHLTMEEEAFAEGARIQGYSWRTICSVEEAIAEIVNFMHLKTYAPFTSVDTTLVEDEADYAKPRDISGSRR